MNLKIQKIASPTPTTPLPLLPTFPSTMIIANVTNKDCSVRVDPFYNVVGLAKLMTLNKELNVQAMKLLGKTYRIKVPKYGLRHMGRLLTDRNQEIAKAHMIPGIKIAEAALRMECMLCSKNCRGILEYGFVGHSQCVTKFEKKFTSDSEVELSDLHHLRKRSSMFVIRKGIPGVFPRSMSLEGYLSSTTAYPTEVARAKENAAIRKEEEAVKLRKKATMKRVNTEKDERQASIVKAGIEAITGRSSQAFFQENGYDVEYVAVDSGSPTFGGSGYYLEEFPCVLRFETGQQCIDALNELKKHGFDWSERFYILKSKSGETISYRVVMDRLRERVKRRTTG